MKKQKRKRVLRCLILALLLLGLAGQFLNVRFAPMVKATTFFEDGFESGTFDPPDPWTGISGTPTIVTDPVANGTYAMSCNALEYAYKTLPSSQPVVYHRFYVRTNTVPATGEYIAFVRGRAGGTVIYEVTLGYSDAAKWRFSYRDGTTWTSEWSDTVAVVNTWYCVELYWKLGESDGEVILYVDENIVASVSGKDTADYGNCDTIENGVPYESLVGSFQVVEDSVVVSDTGTGDVPIHSDVNVNSTLAGQPAEFVVKWTSPNLNLSYGIFGTNNTGTWENETAVVLNGTVDWLNTTKTLNSTVDLRVEWRAWANDTEGNWGDTGVSYLITQSSAPQSSYEATNSTYAGKGVQLSVKWTGINLEGGIFGWNNSGTPTNDSWVDFWTGTPDVAWMYINKTLNSTVDLTIEWQAWVNNTGSEWGTTGSQYLVTTETNVSITIISPTNTTYSGAFSIEIDADFVPSAESYNYSVTADSGYHADIQSAIDDVEAHGGGAVYIPEGTFNFVNVNESWTGTKVTIPAGVSIFGAGCLTTDFDETDQVSNWKTVLVMPYSAGTPGGDPAARWFFVSGNEDPNKHTRISGFAMVGYRYFDNDDTKLYEATRVEGVMDFRLDHLLLRDIAGNGIVVSNNLLPNVLGNGVIDHCKLINSAGIPAPYETRSLGYGIYPRISWSSQYWDDNRVELIGTYNNRTVFVEDCYFQRWRHSIASNQAVHYVFRYNTIKNDWGYGSGAVDSHGQLNPANTATMVVEVYNNTITDPIMPRQYTQGAIGLRGGCGVVCDNIVGDHYYGISLYYEAIDDKYAIHDMYVWDNTVTNCSVNYKLDGLVENHNYFLRAPTQEQDGFTYTPYPYPHPLTIVGGASGVEAVWYNIKYSNGSWYYGQNQTYTESIEVELLAGSYNFYVWANNTYGDIDGDTVWFTIHGYFSTQALADYNTNLQNSGLPYITETTEVIITLSYSSNRLTFTVNASTEVTSTTKVYSDNRPTYIKGESYSQSDYASNLFNITCTFSGTKTFTLSYENFGGTSIYSSTGEVSGTPSYSNNILIFTINKTGTSVSEVFVGVKGEPKTVSGASYTYNSGTNILTLTITHSSEEEVTLNWNITPPVIFSNVFGNVFLAIGLMSLGAIAVVAGVLVTMIRGFTLTYEAVVYLSVTLIVVLIGAVIALMITSGLSGVFT